MPAMYSLTAAALLGTALTTAESSTTDENNTDGNVTDNSSGNVTSDENNTDVNETDNSSGNVTSDENNTDVNETDGGDGNMNETDVSGNGSTDVTTGQNTGTNSSTENNSTVPQVEVHVVKVTMETSTTLDFPTGSNVSELLATPEAKAKTKAAIEKDMQKALDASTSSAAASRRESGNDAASSPWEVEVTKMEAQTETKLDVDTTITKSVDSESGAPTDAAKTQISAAALADTKKFFDGLGSSTLKLDELAVVYKETTGETVPAEFTVASTSVSNQTTTEVETEMRDPTSGTSTGSGSSSGTGSTSSGGSSTGSNGSTVNGTEDASGASGIALGLAGSVAFVLSALI